MIRWSKKHAVFVQLNSHCGLTGLGECWCFDTEPDALVAYLKTEVLPHLLGHSVDKIRSTLDALRRRATLTARHGMLASASSGIDIALWDLCARQQRLPLCKLINADASTRVRLYASGGLYGLDKSNADLCDELRGFVDSGFAAVKMKVGGLSVDEDAQRVQQVRQAIGADTELIVDGVYSFDLDSAMAFFKKIQDCDIAGFQSPVEARQIGHMATLRRAGVPVMGVEAEYREEILTSYIDDGAVQILQVAPIACGGVSTTLHLADRARAAGIVLSPEVSSTALATMVACHLAAAHEAIVNVEYHSVHQSFFDHLPFTPADLNQGHVSLPSSPGLGLTLPIDAMHERLHQRA